MKHKWQSKEDAIKTAEERTGEKFDLLPCPHCGHSANLTDPDKDPNSWGGYRWEIVCSSSHCRARVCMVADGWFEQVDMELNPGYPSNGYTDRITNLRRMWNRRAGPAATPARREPMADTLRGGPRGPLDLASTPAPRPTDSELLAVLNAARIALKSRDQSSFEMKVLEGLKAAIAMLEAPVSRPHRGGE